MTITRGELIGVWSAGHMYGPGAQSDVMLIFKEDGSGRIDVINWTLCSADLFQWDINADGTLRITGEARLALAKSGVVKSASELSFQSLSFGVAEEKTPSGRSMRVLRPKIGTGMPDHYGFVRRELDGFDEPEF